MSILAPLGTLAAIGWKVIPDIAPGSLRISPHGLGIAIGYALGGALLARRAERLYGIKREDTFNMLTYAVIGVIVGARLFFVVGHIADYLPENPLGMLKVWEGGVVLYGGIFGGIAAAYPYARKHKINYVHILDAAAPGFPLGLIFGRIGDLMIGDHLGGTTDFFLGYRYRGGIGCDPSLDCLPDFQRPLGIVLHQTALYDLISVLPLLFVVLALGRKRRPDGWLISFAAVWYATGRLIIDFTRTTTPTYFGLRGTQWVSVALIAIGLVWLVWRARRAPVAQPHHVRGSLTWETEDEGADLMVSEGSPAVHVPEPPPQPAPLERETDDTPQGEESV